MTEYHVSPNGSDNGLGTQSSPFRQIKTATDRVQPGDTVIIHSGTYNEIIQPRTSGRTDAPITYKGAPGETPPLIAGGDLYHPCCIAIGWEPTITWPKDQYGNYTRLQVPEHKSSVGYPSNPVSYIIIDGLSISYRYCNDPASINKWGPDETGGYDPEGRFGYITIDNYASVGNVVRNCKIWQPGDYKQNMLNYTAQAAIRFAGHKALFENNEMFGMKWGVWLTGEAPRNLTIRGNNIHDIGCSPIDNGSPMTKKLAGTLIENNILGPTYNEDGIQFEPAYGVILKTEYSNCGVIIRNNTFVHCAENSIDLKGAGFVLIEGNMVYGSPGQDDGGIKEDYSQGGAWRFNNELWSQDWVRESDYNAHPEWYSGGAKQPYHDSNGRVWYNYQEAQNRGGGDGFIALGAGDTAHYIIVRNNVAYDNKGVVEFMNHMKFYNNTFVCNNRDYTGADTGQWNPPQGGFLGSVCYGSQWQDDWNWLPTYTTDSEGRRHYYMLYYGSVFKNNLVAGHNQGETAFNYGCGDRLEIDYNIYANDKLGAKCLRQPGGNDWGWYTVEEIREQYNSLGVKGWDEHSRYVRWSELEFSNVPYGPVGPPAVFDFSLKSTSVAKNAGSHLTYTLDGGSGRTIRVNDARLFCDGFGCFDWDTGERLSDTILVECSDGISRSVKIESISSDDQTITLESSLPSWNQYARVTLESLGFTPDIGAILSSTEPQENPPKITVQPQNTTAYEGDTATFSITATGTEPIFYQWQAPATNIAGATQRTYTTPILNIDKYDGNSYRCIVKNSYGTVTSEIAYLTVLEKPADQAPIITSDPINKKVTKGSTAEFKVTATGTPPLSYQWTKNGAIIPDAISPTYITTPTALTDDGTTYQCSVTNVVGTAKSTSALLQVVDISYDSDTSIKNGDFENQSTEPWVFYTNGSGGFKVEYVGTPTPYAAVVTLDNTATNVQLYQTGFMIKPYPAQYILEFWAMAPNNNKLSVTIQQHTAPYTDYGLADEEVQLTNEWKLYSIMFTANFFPEATTDTRLRFWFAPYAIKNDVYYFDDIKLIEYKQEETEKDPPVIYTQPTDQEVFVGDAATFSVVVTGKMPLLYQWYMDGELINGATGPMYTTPPFNAKTKNESSWWCVISNSDGTVTSNSVTVIIKQQPVTYPPVITQHPQNQSVVSGKTATLYVSVSGTEPFTYAWKVLRPGDEKYENVGNGNNASYTTEVLTADLNGIKYKCVVLNSVGTVTSLDATITVAPSDPGGQDDIQIIKQPESFFGKVGDTATFNVEVDVKIPENLSYQWYRNGIAISDASGRINTLIMSNLVIENDQDEVYCVIAYNGASGLKEARTNFVSLSVSESTDPKTDYQKGYQDGWSVGHGIGYKAGFAVGETSGKEAGYKTGYDAGYAKAMEEAGGNDQAIYQQGYDAGLAKGLEGRGIGDGGSEAEKILKQYQEFFNQVSTILEGIIQTLMDYMAAKGIK